MPLQDKTIDDLSAVPSTQVSDTDDFVVVRTGSSANRQSRKMSVTEFRLLMFRSLSATAMDILENVTASATEVNVLDGVITGSNGVTAARINYLAGVSPGIAEANKVLVLGSGRNVDFLRVGELYLRNETEMVEATASELNRLHNVPNALTKTDLGNLPRLLELFLDPAVTVSFPDFSTVSNDTNFNVVVGNLRLMRGSFVGVGVVNVKMVINGATVAGGIREEMNDAVGQTTLVFMRGATTDATKVVISSGTNTYTLEMTFRGIKLSYSGTFTGNSSSSSPPAFD